MDFKVSYKNLSFFVVAQECMHVHDSSFGQRISALSAGDPAVVSMQHQHQCFHHFGPNIVNCSGVNLEIAKLAPCNLARHWSAHSGKLLKPI
jgi:hypothetical protein